MKIKGTGSLLISIPIVEHFLAGKFGWIMYL